MVSLSCELRLCTPMLFFLLVGDSTSCGIFAELPTLVAQPAGQPVVDPAVQPSLAPFYDPVDDDQNEEWALKQRQGRKSDAVLTCPACLTTLCIDCQRCCTYLLLPSSEFPPLPRLQLFLMHAVFSTFIADMNYT
jgi:hypothetical protein